MKDETMKDETMKDETMKDETIIDETIKETVRLQFETIHLFHKNFAKTLHPIRNSQYDLNKNQNKAIIIIGAAENIMPTTLGKYLDLQKGSLTSMIDALEKYELVCRKKDQEDRRKTLLVLTEKGEKYREWLIGEFEKNASEILKKLGEEDIIEYRKSLQTMFNILKKLDETS
jgi:MarR family transcriptional regulator, organic hydroperoxide resistance regulator